MKSALFLPFLTFLLALISCQKDFIVENIERRSLTVNAPTDNLATSNNLVTFWWEPLNGAEWYNLQVVTPSFANTSRLILDTNTTSNKFNLTLEPGLYQWRIKGENAGHSTAYRTFNLKIDTSSNLSGQMVNLISPANGAVLGSKTVVFSWGGLSAAKKYKLLVNNGQVLDSLTTKTTFTTTLPALAGFTTAFTWNVKAMNDNSEGPFAVSPFTFTVDLKPPAAPSLLSPGTGSIIKDTTLLKWSRGTVSDVLYDSVYVATDSTFANVISQTGTDQTTLRINELNNAPNPNSSSYWWKVRSFDVAGNRSSASVSWKFTLIP